VPAADNHHIIGIAGNLHLNLECQLEPPRLGPRLRRSVNEVRTLERYVGGGVGVNV
jgi:hypothetical protein